MMASSVCNMLKSSKSRPFKASDFMPFSAQAPATIESVTAKLEAFAAGLEKKKRKG